jgi:hypothetical protein
MISLEKKKSFKLFSFFLTDRMLEVSKGQTGSFGREQT